MKRARLSLKVDSREQKEVRLVPALRKHATVQVVKLEIGDIVPVSESCYVERKTLHDYIGSLIDGRLFRQLNKTFDTGKPAFMVIFHEEPKSKKAIAMYKMVRARITKEQLYGSFATVLVRYGVPIIGFNLPAEFSDMAYCVAKMIEKVEQEKFLKPRRLYVRKKKNVPFCVQMVSQLLSISTRIAGHLLNEFGSIEGICKASEVELLNVPGIGNTRASNIHVRLTKDWRVKKSS